MISTILQWVAIFLAVAGYILYTKKETPTGQRIIANANRLLDTSNSGSEKKKRTVKKEKKQKTGKELLSVPKVTLESESNDDIPDINGHESLKEDKNSLQRLAGLKASQIKPGKTEPKTEKKSGGKASAKGSQVDLTKAPISPSLGAISSTSSTTGADGDIDEPDSVDEFGDVGDANPAADMLETITGPSVLRIIPAQDEFTTVTRRSKPQTEKKDGLTPLQKKNAKKNEMKKELKKLEKEDQLKRLEAHKKEQRLAREAEAAKQPVKIQPPPASNAWASESAKPTSSSVNGGLLDVFDNSRPKTIHTPPSSTSEYGGLSLSEDQRQEIPPQVLAEYIAERNEMEQPEKEWVEVKKPKKERRKQHVAESETDSDANRAPPVQQVAPAKASAPAKKQPSMQDLKIPAMPAMESSNGWDAHAW